MNFCDFVSSLRPFLASPIYTLFVVAIAADRDTRAERRATIPASSCFVYSGNKTILKEIYAGSRSTCRPALAPHDPGVPSQSLTSGTFPNRLLADAVQR